MVSFKIISIRILLFLIDLVYFTFQTIRQIVLPTKHKTGNLLSTLFVFFLGISERLLSFEKQLFKNRQLFQNPYLKQAFIVAASLLFLLTSFEWVESPIKTFSEQTCTSNNNLDKSTKSIHQFIALKPAIFSAYIQNNVSIEPYHSQPSFYKLFPIYLQVRNLRI